MNPTLLATFGFMGGVVVALVDGRRAVTIAAAASGLSLAGTAALVAGPPGLLIIGLAIAATAVLHFAATAASSRLRSQSPLDPLVPLFSPAANLFGPRSTRVAAATLAIPLASWLSFNVPVGDVANVQGLMFGAAYVWLCGAARLLVARSVEDLSIGLVAISFASATGWMVRSGANATDVAVVAVAIAPLTALVVGWLRSRHIDSHAAVT